MRLDKIVEKSEIVASAPCPKRHKSGASIGESAADHVPLPVIAGEMNRNEIPFGRLGRKFTKPIEAASEHLRRES